MVKMQAVTPDRVRERIGLLIQQVTPIEIALSEIRIESKYPQMFGALLALAKSVASVKTFGMQGFYHCEFRMSRKTDG